MKKGFTLVELLVVIGILAVLMGVLISALGGSSDSARAAKCLSNMKNLAAAVQSYGAANIYFPYAGSIQYMDINTSRGKGNSKLVYNERRGWISWDSRDLYPSDSKKAGATIPMSTTDEDLGMYALTNGALWRYISGGRSVYVCPMHLKKNPKARWSYLMNAYFGWSANPEYAFNQRHHGVDFSGLSGAERRLLFSEVPFQGPGEWFPDGTGESDESDAILQYKGCSKASTVSSKGAADGNEHIGANHKSGRNWFAHVVFADGHVEKIRVSTDKGNTLKSDDLRELTTWLCQGKAVSFTGTKYEEMD